MKSDGTWIRPVSSREDGTLFQQHYQFADGDEPHGLDLVRIDLLQPRPEPHQPENWLLAEGQWELTARPAPGAVKELLISQLVHGPEILGDTFRRVSYEALVETPISASLALVQPSNLRWQITKNTLSGRRQTRAWFNLGHASYDLPVTDPLWEKRLAHLENGVYSAAAAGYDSEDDLFLTISLSGPLEQTGYCYI